MNIVIRKANLSDVEAIHRLIENLAPLFLTQVEFSQLESFKIEKYQDYLQDAQYCFYVALDAQKIVGVIALRQPTHLYHLYVDQSYHGQGIAKRLWQYLLRFQFNKKPANTIVTVNSSLYAVDLYKKFGFEPLIDGHEESNGIQFVPMQFVMI